MQQAAPDEGPSGESPTVPDAAARHVAFEPDVEERHDPKFLRSVVRKRGIDSTQSLVSVYNATKDRDERAVLLRWLRRYNSRKEECMRPRTVHEYAELAKIKQRTKQDADIPKTLISNLASCIIENKFLERSTATALYYALKWVDPTVYEETELFALVKRFLSSLSLEPKLTRENFAEYKTMFLILQRTFFLLHSTCQRGLDEEEKQELRQVVAMKKNELKLSRKHYPVRFHLKLIEQCVERLDVENSPSTLTKALRCLSCGMYGALHAFCFVKNLLAIDINPKDLEKALRRLQQVIIGLGVSEERWFDAMQALMVAGWQASKEDSKLELFVSAYRAVSEYEQKIRRIEDLKAIRFGIIQELGTLAIDGASKIVRDEATTKLVELAMGHAVQKGWIKDSDLMESLLGVLHELHMSNEQAERTSEALQTIQQLYTDHSKERLTEWSAPSRMRDNLEMRRHAKQSWETSDLSIKIGRDAGYLPISTTHSIIEDLKKGYLDKDFATVVSLFDREASQHVKDMKHHIVIYEEIIEEKGLDPREGIEEKAWKGARTLEGRKDHTRERYEKKKRVQKPIALNELFKPRSLKAGIPEREIRRVLLYGDPGSGKTCISKLIANKWASGELAQEFKAVYVVPVRALNGAESKSREWGTYEAAISQICFSKRLNDQCEDLGVQIDDDLDLPSTLLMLDGLDEADDVAKKMVSAAEERQCKILLLTRPYNLQNIRTRIDIEVECLGFNDEQLRGYISSELPKDNAEMLIHSLQTNPAMWEMAHIPVTAHILCSLSVEQGTASAGEERKSSIFQIYNDMVDFVWKRFEEKQDTAKLLKSDVFSALEKIAFEALRSGQILIEQRLMTRHAASANPSKIFKESGFLLLLLERQEYQSPHLTFQEYFAGRHIARCLQNKGITECQKVTKFLQKGKYLAKNTMCLSFAMHAFAEVQEERALQEMLGIVNEGPIELFGLQHFFLKIRILDAALAEANEETKEVLKRDTKAISLTKATRKLIQASVNDEMLRRRVVEHMERCSNTLKVFPWVLEDLVEEMKRKLMSEDGLGDQELDKVRDVIKLGKHTNNNIEQLVEATREMIESPLKRKREDAVIVSQMLFKEVESQNQSRTLSFDHIALGLELFALN